MCSDNYCRGYRVAARMKGTPDSGDVPHRLPLRALGPEQASRVKDPKMIQRSLLKIRPATPTAA